MKIDRLLSIVIHLLSRDLVSASDLAERFGVTVRTIQRDVDAINAAGIPVTAIHGPSGGYKILDAFRLDRQFLSFDDLFFITTALQGIADSLESTTVEKTADKIRSLAARHSQKELASRAERLYIDFSALGYSAHRQGHMSLVQNAVERCRCISFTYTSSRLEQSRRVVEPHTLVFKWYSWYLLAWCRTRKDFRLFRLSRIRDPQLGHEVFRRRPVDLPKLLDGLMARAPTGEPVVLRFKPELRVMVEDYFTFGEIATEEDGNLTVTVDFPEDNWLYGMILSYGDGVEVVAPPRLRKRIADICEKNLRLYKQL
jgi:predicted DNA-binding transcriptional regulator YafY